MSLENLKVIILKLKQLRVVSFGAIDDEICLLEEDTFWDEIDDVSDVDELYSWILQLRDYVWGSESSFSEASEFFSLDEIAYYQSRICDILGFELFKIIEDDQSVKDFIEKTIAENNELVIKSVVDDFVRKNKIREGNFSKNESNVSVDENKISRIIISQLAKSICEEFSIRKISFSNNIPESDCFKYLLELAYSLPDFSSIIKSKNIGLGYLSVAFETHIENVNATNYNCNFKQINISIDGYGSFSHEWLHFIDHTLGDKIPFNKANSFFSESSVPEHKKQLFKLKKSILQKFSWEYNPIKSFCSMKTLLFSLPLLLNSIFQKYNEIDRFKNNLFELDLFIFNVLRNETKTVNLHNEFKVWEKSLQDSLDKYISTLSEPVQESALQMKQEITNEINFVYEQSFNRYREATEPSWVMLSKKEDDKNQQVYASLNSEMMSRSFELYIMCQFSRKNWISYRNVYGITYPKGKECEIENEWWDQNLGEILKICS